MITMNKEINKQVKDYIRCNHSSGYPLVLVMKDGGYLCQACAKREVKLIFADTREGWSTEWTAAGVQLFMEGPAEECAHCYTVLESAYGDPYAEE